MECRRAFYQSPRAQATASAGEYRHLSYPEHEDTGLFQHLRLPPRPPRITPRRWSSHHGEAVHPDTTVAPALGDDSQPLFGAYSGSRHSHPSPHRARKPFPSRWRPQRPFLTVGRALTGRPTRPIGRRLAFLAERQHPQRRHRNVRKQEHRQPQHT